MTILQVTKVLILVVLMSTGQVLFKLAASQMKMTSVLGMILSLATNIYMIVALALYGVATLLWVIVLKEVPLSRAYPITALSMFIVPAMGLLVFREPMSWSLIAGGALLIAGGYIIALN